MAVTIDEMQVHVQSRKSQPGQQTPAAAPPKETESLFRQMEILAERALRLKTD